MEFELHEGHAFWNDCKRDEVRAEKLTEIIDGLVIDFIDAQGQPINIAFGDEFAFQSTYPLDEVVESFQKRCVAYLFRTDTSDSLSREPATFVVLVKDFEVASLNLDNQPELLGSSSWSR